MTLTAPLLATAVIRQDPFLILLTPVFALLGVVVGIYLFFRGFRLLARKRLIEATPRSAIRSAAMGQVEVTGKIVGPYMLISPFSQLECFYYRARAWRYEGEGNSRRRKKVAEETLCVPFFVEDETGRLMVDPRDAELDWPPSYDDECNEYTESVLRFMRRRGITDSSFLKLEEHCIQPGDQLFVLGTLAENRGPQSIASLQGNPSQQGDIHFLSRAAADLQTREALEEMKIPVPRYSAARATPEEEFDTNPPALLRKASGQPFFLSRYSPHAVVEDLAWKSAMYIWGGPVLALVSAGLLLVKLNLW
jgi:E3 Ubiquitin ligase